MAPEHKMQGGQNLPPPCSKFKDLSSAFGCQECLKYPKAEFILICPLPNKLFCPNIINELGNIFNFTKIPGNHEPRHLV